MNALEAKKLVQRELQENGIRYEKLTARTVSFEDLSRTSRVFVKVHGAEPAAKLQLVERNLRGTGVLLDPII